jgi:probable Rubsico expression protein CbbX
MRTARLRHAGLGIFMLVFAGVSLLAWLRLNHLAFATIEFSAVFLIGLVVVARDGYRQTNEENLRSRGIEPGGHNLPVYDPGLRRDWPGMLPSAVGQRRARKLTGVHAAPPAIRTRPAAAPVAKAGPARRGQARKPGKQDQPLPPDATVNFAIERRDADIDDVFAALDSELIGLVPVKKKVAEIGSLLMVDRARQRFGLVATRPNLHMCFTGAPGTGKTTVALMMGELLHRLGYLERGHLVHAMRDDLVGEFIGQTAPRTKYVLDRAMGGVLFIDEAYSLFRADDSRDYGQECVDILMQVMENERDKLVVILAGYKDRMDNFFESSPGMRSRIAHHLDFASYHTDELLDIGQLMLERSSYYLSAAATAALRDYLSKQMTQPQFANARSVRNALEGARLRHAHRLAAEPERPWTKDDLMRLEPQDVLPGRDSVQPRLIRTG